MLEVENLAVLRGERLVFQGVSFRVTACGALVVGGANGAGKSSLLRVLAGLGRAEAGAVRWAGGIAYVGHLDAVKPGLTVAENLAFHGIAGLEALGLADLADMPARFYRRGKSGGWRWRGWWGVRLCCGFWMSRRWGWMRRQWIGLGRSWRRIGHGAALWSRRRMWRCRCRGRLRFFSGEDFLRIGGAGIAAFAAPFRG